MQRAKQHRASSSWFGQATTIRLETFPNRRAAENAEAAAIRKEKPLANILHNHRHVDVVEPFEWVKNQNVPIRYHREHWWNVAQMYEQGRNIGCYGENYVAEQLLLPLEVMQSWALDDNNMFPQIFPLSPWNGPRAIDVAWFLGFLAKDKDMAGIEKFDPSGRYE